MAILNGGRSNRVSWLHTTLCFLSAVALALTIFGWAGGIIFIRTGITIPGDLAGGFAFLGPPVAVLLGLSEIAMAAVRVFRRKPILRQQRWTIRFGLFAMVVLFLGSALA